MSFYDLKCLYKIKHLYLYDSKKKKFLSNMKYKK